MASLAFVGWGGFVLYSHLTFPKETTPEGAYARVVIAITKFAAALWTGSSAMLSEGVHSLVDTGNQGLLLYGHRRASRPPDERHPLGFGRELYFWSFIVALLVFALGAGVSLYEGIAQIRERHPITDPSGNYAVIAFSVVFEGASWWIALQEFRKTKGDLSYIQAFKRSKNAPLFLVLFEDTAALIGLAIAFAGNPRIQPFCQARARWRRVAGHQSGAGRHGNYAGP